MTRSSDDSTVEPTLPDPLAAGATLDNLPARYRAGELLGSGGMGEVYLCRDAHVRREVALKVLRPGASAARFVREARIQGQLEHPSIVPVHELGGADEAPWFTMRRVRGLTLAEVLDGLIEHDAAIVARFPRRRLLTAFASVCLTIDYAHSRGVVHRDLKPANIMLGDFGEVHVLDWGVARAAGDEAGGDAVQVEGAVGATALGTVVGTPGYMAPEQARGEHDRLDARADVYALGAVLFEILTLSALHAGATTDELIASTLAGASRPAQRAPWMEVPPELDGVCATATASAPDERFPSARVLGEAVERFLDGDRDLALRRELADRHEAAGRAALADLEAPGEAGSQARATAMRELGAALALAPERSTVAATMTQLMMEPPREVPVEVEQELRAGMARDRGQGARLLPLTYAGWTLFAPFLFWMGVRSVAWLVVTAVVVAGASLSAWVYIRRGTHDVAHGLAIMTANTLAVALMSGIFGPLILVPTVALATNVFVAMLGGAARLRVYVVVANLLCVLAPLALELLGVLPPSMSFDGERLMVHARAVAFPALPSELLLLLATIVAVALPVLLVHKARGDIWSIERKLMLQAWHLRAIVERAGRTAAVLLAVLVCAGRAHA